MTIGETGADRPDRIHLYDRGDPGDEQRHLYDERGLALPESDRTGDNERERDRREKHREQVLNPERDGLRKGRFVVNSVSNDTVVSTRS